MASFWESLFGSPEQIQQVQRFTPQQQRLQSSALQQVMGMLPGLQQQTDFAPIEQRARTQFQEQTVPSLAERFTALGGRAGAGSFAQRLGQAGAGLEEGLAAQRAQFGLQQRNLQQQLLGQLLGFGMQPQFESILRPGTQGAIPALSAPILQSLGSGLGFALGGPIGGITGNMLGSGIGSGISSLLSQFGSQSQTPNIGLQAPMLPRQTGFAPGFRQQFTQQYPDLFGGVI